MKKMLVMALSLGLIVGFVAMANAEVKIGGSLRTELVWGYASEDFGGDEKFKVDTFNGNYSRLKFTYLSDDKKFKGYAEIGVYSRHLNGNNVATRHAYFTYSWGTGSLLFGQTTAIEQPNGPASWQNGWGLTGGYGWQSWSRNEQIRLTLGEKYRLRVAIEAPLKNAAYDDAGATVTGYHYLPAIAASMKLNFGNVAIMPWARWEWVRYDLSLGSKNVNSLDFGVEIAGDFGLVGFIFGANYGYNTSAMGDTVTGNAADTYPIYSATDTSNHKEFGFYGNLTIGGLSFGAGYQSATRDALDGVDLWAQRDWRMAAFINYKIPFGKIKFIPELTWRHGGESYAGVSRGDQVKVGVYMVLDF